MKQVLTLMILLFAIATQSYAIKPVVVVDDAAAVTVDYQKDNSVFSNVKTFVAKKYTAIKNVVNNMAMEKGLLIILAIFIPPLAVYFAEGQTWTKAVTLNLILTLLCGLPGMIHALIVVTK